MLPDRVSNPGPLTYESGALPIALRGPALLSLFCVKHYSGQKHYIYIITRALPPFALPITFKGNMKFSTLKFRCSLRLRNNCEPGLR